MQTVHPSNRGQVLIIFVFAIIGLIGITALAIDGGNTYQERRQAQNAADSAALASALTMVRAQQAGASLADCQNFTGGVNCGRAVLKNAQNTAASNGFAWNDWAHVDSFTVNIPPDASSPYHDCSSTTFTCTDYVQVIITSHVNTFFAKVLGIGTLPNRVQAVALAKYRPFAPLYGGDALVILAPDSVNGASGEFGTKGTATVHVQGGSILVNSQGSNAFVEASCIDFEMDPGKSINVVGQWDIPPCTYSLSLNHITHVQFPPDEPIPTEPAECHQTPTPHADWPDGYAHLSPGYYSTAGSNKFPPDKNTRLDPGVYCIDGLLKTTNPNTHLVGSNVLIYVRKGGSFTFGGGSATLTAPAAGQPYAGYLIYAAPDYSLTGGSIPECTINAGAGDTFTGVIYAPYCNVTINGGSDSVGLRAKLVAYTLLLNGSNTLTFYYDDSTNPGTPEVINTGLYH